MINKEDFTLLLHVPRIYWLIFLVWMTQCVRQLWGILRHGGLSWWPQDDEDLENYPYF